MNSMRLIILVSLILTLAGARASVLDDTNFFPIAVWVQQPKNAERFKAAGINLYVGLWHGPTAEQLDALEKARMPVICHQNEFGLEQKNNPIILAWMHGDEPDNAQPLKEGEGWGPPILPSKIQADYEKIRAADPSRPVFLNLGQGVAWDNYIGRGVRRNKPEDYLEYVKGADIVSFDIYPVVHDHKDVAGKLEFVADGVKRLRQWAGPNKKVWNCIECTHISNPDAKASPDQIRSEVWMSLIHGSRGIIYFVHRFKPTFIEAALLQDPENLAAVTRINAQIKELAPVLNSPTIEREIKITSEVPIATMLKQVGGTNYLFTVGMENRAGEATINFRELSGVSNVELIGESRSVTVSNGEFRDRYKPYEVHLYKFRAVK
jgi:hypothetical protein